jgi:hypothetical protein
MESTKKLEKVTFSTQVQLNELSVEVDDSEKFIKSIYDEPNTTIKETAIIIWHCLKMVQLHVSRTGLPVTIDIDFFNHPFSHDTTDLNFQCGNYEEGLYHVLKYGAFIDGMGCGELNISDGAIELAFETLQNLT